MVLMLGTFLAISLAWIPFRAQNIKALQEMTAGLFRTDFVNKLPASATASVLIVVVSMLLGHIWIRETTLEEAISRVPPLVRATVFGALLVSIVLSSTGDSRAFIYFQF
jgi:alginate O-acetyltransferase complex protein AlgI